MTDNIVQFPMSKVLSDKVIDDIGRADLRYNLAAIAGMLTQPVSYTEICEIEARLNGVMMEVLCMKIMAAL